MGLRASGAGVLVLLCLAAVAYPAVETATVTALSGVAAIEPGGVTLAEGDVLQQMEEVTLADGATMTVEFADGSFFELTGPARFRLTELTSQFRTIDLVSGTMNRLVVHEVTTGVRTPYDTFVAAQNKEGGSAVLSVEILETEDGGHQVVYNLLEGGDAKAVDMENGAIEALLVGAPFMIDRPYGWGGARPGGPDTTTAPDDFKIGEHRVIVTTDGGFSAEETPDGGLRLVRTGAGFGGVTVDGDTTFYLDEGGSIVFDANGNVLSHDGIIHVYSPLNYMGLYDDPIDGPATASPTGTTIIK